MRKKLIQIDLTDAEVQFLQANFGGTEEYKGKIKNELKLTRKYLNELNLYMTYERYYYLKIYNESHFSIKENSYKKYLLCKSIVEKINNGLGKNNTIPAISL